MYPTFDQIPSGQFRFRPVRRVGEGGLGYVEEIEVTESNCHHPVGQRLARKLLGSKWNAHPEMRERFEREINALKTMKHPNIVTCQGENVRSSGERFYFMDLYKGSCRTVLEQSIHVDLPAVAQIGQTLAAALRYAHASGFVHRDLKPDNILMNRFEDPIIADWGFGKFIHKDSVVLQNLTQHGFGTAYYCSFEQWASGADTPACDIYSLGMTLAELATGTANRVAIAQPGIGIRQDVVSSAVAGGARFNQLVRKMTSLSPVARPQTMAEVQVELSYVALGV